jgi:hypothetical protein
VLAGRCKGVAAAVSSVVPGWHVALPVIDTDIRYIPPRSSGPAFCIGPLIDEMINALLFNISSLRLFNYCLFEFGFDVSCSFRHGLSCCAPFNLHAIGYVCACADFAYGQRQHSD